MEMMPTVFFRSGAGDAATCRKLCLRWRCRAPAYAPLIRTAETSLRAATAGGVETYEEGKKWVGSIGASSAKYAHDFEADSRRSGDFQKVMGWNGGVKG
jgi:hypothetical protein